MAWEFTRMAGPFEGPAGGVVWDGSAAVFTTIDEGRLLRFDQAAKSLTEVRQYINRVNGLALGPGGELYGAQEGGRRLVEFVPDGRLVAVDALVDGKPHNQPSDLVVDTKHRIWFTDPYHPVIPFGPQIFPLLEHQSVLRFDRNERRAWTATRMTYDTVSPRAVLLSVAEDVQYVADGEPKEGQGRELRAYPVHGDGTLGHPVVLHTFGKDHRGLHRGVEGMCLDTHGNIVACAGWRQSGPGPVIMVFAPSGAVIETHPLPADRPNKCCFGGRDGNLLFVTTAQGELYQAKSDRRGFPRSSN
jgi:gluconolactonase